MALPMFTIQTFNQSVLQPAGAVFAQRVEAVSLLRDFMAGIGGLIGGQSTTMEKKMNDLTKVLQDELQKKAKEQYPNVVALVDVTLTFSDIGTDASSMFIAGQASATALVRAPSKAATPEPAPLKGGRRTKVHRNKDRKTRRRY
jgi:uncharacterized protein YbjQ (UPF0145 family)